MQIVVRPPFIWITSYACTRISMLEIGLNGLSMCIDIFVLLQITWFPLYMFLFAFMIRTLITCALGTISDHYVSVSSVTHLFCTRFHQNEKKLRMAFDEFPWYRPSLVDQRKFIMAIKRLHQPTMLTCGTMKLDIWLCRWWNTQFLSQYCCWTFRINKINKINYCIHTLIQIQAE